MDNINCAYTGGWTLSTDFPTTPNAYIPSFIGGATYSDGWIIKLDTTINLVIPKTVNGSPFCAGSSFTVSFFAPCQVDTGNIFIAQLSDSNGSFSRPDTIGNLYSMTSGSINCKIPLNANYGTGYRIRVNASKPFVIGHVNDADITITSLPKAGFSINDSTQCLMGNNFVFNNSSIINHGIMTYNWNFGDNAKDSIINPAHSYLTFDSFIVQIIAVSDNSCKDTFYDTMITYPMPKAAFTINDTSQCMQGNIFKFTDNSSIKSGSIKQYNFDMGDGKDSSLSAVTHRYLSSDTFMVTLSIKSDQGCPDSITKTIYVIPMPTAVFSINKNPQNLTGNSFLFTSTASIPSGSLLYFWDFGDGNNSNQPNPNHSYTKTGKYHVMMKVISDFGCTDSFIDTAVIRLPNIKPSFTYQSACVGIPVYFKNTSTLSPPDSFLNFIWDYGDSNQTIIFEDPQHIYYYSGRFIIKLVCLTAFGNKDTLIDTIEVYPAPIIDITAVPDSILIPGTSVTLNASGVYDQLLWWDNSNGQSVTVQKSGKYWVTASYINGCKSSDTIWIVDGEKKEIELVTVFTPNGDGYNDYFVIRNVQNYQPVKLSIYNRWGDELYSSSNYQNNWDGTYKGKHLPEGSYYYILETKDGKVYKGAVNIFR